MSKPTNEFAAVLRQQPIPAEAKVHLYLLHIATKKDEVWFAMVKSRTIGEALDIDSNREVQEALRKIGATEGTSTFKNRVVPGYFIPRSNRDERSDRNSGNAGTSGLRGTEGVAGTAGTNGTTGVEEQQEHGPRSNEDSTQVTGVASISPENSAMDAYERRRLDSTPRLLSDAEVEDYVESLVRHAAHGGFIRNAPAEVGMALMLWREERWKIPVILKAAQDSNRVVIEAGYLPDGTRGEVIKVRPSQ